MIVRMVPGVEIVRIAKSAGFDTLYIDLEHSSFSIHTASQICIMALEAGIPAFVRVPANTPEHISRVLDGGAGICRTSGTAVLPRPRRSR